MSCAKSTLASGIIRPHDGHSYTVVKFKSQLRKGRRLGSIKIRYYESRTPSSSLVYIMSGIGGAADSGPSNFLASQMVKNGHHAVILPSTFTEEFARSYSDTGYVGLIHRDAWDLLELVDQARSYVRNRGHRIKSIKMIGYSLGALTAAHVSDKAGLVNTEADEQDVGDVINKIRFDRVLMINTPVDLIYGLRNIDRSLEYKSQLGFRKFFTLGLSVIKTLKEAEKLPLSNESYQMALDRLESMGDDEANLFIATSLSSSLGGVVRSSQDIYDLGILPEKPIPGSVMENRMMAERSGAISSVSFEEYIEKFVVLYYRGNNPDEEYRNYTLQNLNQRVSLYSVADHIKKNTRIFLMHNQDDFLLRGEEDVDYLRSLFGERATFYPRGGHMGNLWFKDNLEKIIATLR